MNKDFANSEERLALNAEALGLDLSEIKEGMRCAYKPPCGDGFVENQNGCCDLEITPEMSKSDKKLILAIGIMQEIIKGYIISELIEVMLKSGGERLAMKLGGTNVKRFLNKATGKYTLKLVDKLKAKQISKQTGKIGAKLGSKLAAKVGMGMTKLAKAMSSYPIIAFEIASAKAIIG